MRIVTLFTTLFTTILTSILIASSFIFIFAFSAPASAHYDHSKGMDTGHILYHIILGIIFVAVVISGYLWIKAKLTNQR
jgi:heme/copper-type cytochrome/quinol oxidase subunit 3